MRATWTLIILLLVIAVSAQPMLPLLRPVVHGIPSLNPQAFATYALRDSLLKTSEDLDPDGMRLLHSLLRAGYDETMESPGDISSMGCSWHCGGGPDSVWASSARDTTHHATSMHDLSYCTAWCAGVDAGGVGEPLVYHFAPDGRRLHTIIVGNRSVADLAIWEEAMGRHCIGPHLRSTVGVHRIVA